MRAVFVAMAMAWGMVLRLFAQAPEDVGLRLGVGEVTTVRYTLDRLEKEVRKAPEARLAQAELQLHESLLTREEALDGVEFFGSAAVGRYKDLVDEDSIWYHTGGRFLGGLSYPLLGSRAQKEMAVLKAKASVEEKRLLEKETLRRTLLELRSAYIGYWSAMQKVELAEASLAHEEETEAMLWKRVEAGLLLASDAIDVESQFLRARRMLQKSRQAAARNLAALRTLTGDKLSPFVPYVPRLPVPAFRSPHFYTRALERDPMVALYRSRFAHALEGAKKGAYRVIESDVRLVGFVNPEFDTSRQGDGVEISFNIRLPLSWNRAVESQKRADAVAVQKALLALKKAGQERLMALQEAVRAFETAEENHRYALSRLQAAKSYLREMELAEGKTDRATPSALQTARYRYLLVAENYVDAYADRELAKARLLAWAEEDVKKEAVSRAPRSLTDPLLCVPASLPTVRKEGSLGLYVWRSGEVLESAERFLALCKERGVTRVLLSLDGEQVAALDERKFVQKLQGFVTRARKQGITVEALLGEPTWLLPKQRPKLMAILLRLNETPFAAVHLDIEPDQLSGEHSPQWLAEALLLTVEEAQRVSTKPVGLSLHPRYLDPEAVGMPLGRLLAELDLYEVAVMIYGLGPVETGRRIGALRKAYPSLPLTLAVSAERNMFANALPPANDDAWRQWLDGAREAVGRKGVAVLIQDYSHWARMEP
ncbi:TolC family protein [Hydrogenimonas sp.]